MPTNRQLTGLDLLALLERKYAPPSWALFTEVKSSVGAGNRVADAVAVAMWHSLGLEIHGFEIKMSRVDWLRELKDASKSDEILSYCDRWWLVAPNAGIVKDGELPGPWGMMVPSGKGLRCIVRAPKLKPKPLTRWFVAEILRRAFSQKLDLRVNEHYQKGYAAGKAAGKDDDSGELKSLQREANRLTEAIQYFEKASGVKIELWNSGKIGEAVKMIVEKRANLENIEARMRWFQNNVRAISELLDNTLRPAG